MINTLVKVVEASGQKPLGGFDALGYTIRAIQSWDTGPGDPRRSLKTNAKQGLRQFLDWMEVLIQESGCKNYEEFILGYDPGRHEAIPDDQLDKLKTWNGYRSKLDELGGMVKDDMSPADLDALKDAIQNVLSEVAQMAMPLYRLRTEAKKS